MHNFTDEIGFDHIFQNVEVEEERVDERSVDDLLSFINGGEGGMHSNASLTIYSYRFTIDTSFCYAMENFF